MAKKRPMDESDVLTRRKSKAARFNAHTLKKLQAAVSDDPEIDLTTRMPIEYSNRLTGMRSAVDHSLCKHSNKHNHLFHS